MYLPTVRVCLSAWLASTMLFATSGSGVAEDLLKEDFKDAPRVESRWTLSSDTGKAVLVDNEIRLSGAGFPTLRSNEASNFNDDGAKPIRYSVDYSVEQGQMIFWVRMDELGIPSGSALLQGGTNAVQGYRIDVAPSSGKGRVALSRHLFGQSGTTLWQNDPGVGSGVSLNEGTLTVELVNDENSVVITISFNGKELVSWVDDSPERILSGMGVGASAFEDDGNSALKIRGVEVSR